MMNSSLSFQLIELSYPNKELKRRQLNFRDRQITFNGYMNQIERFKNEKDKQIGQQRLKNKQSIDSRDNKQRYQNNLSHTKKFKLKNQKENHTLTQGIEDYEQNNKFEKYKLEHENNFKQKNQELDELFERREQHHQDKIQVQKWIKDNQSCKYTLKINFEQKYQFINKRIKIVK